MSLFNPYTTVSSTLCFFNHHGYLILINFTKILKLKAQFLRNIKCVTSINSFRSQETVCHVGSSVNLDRGSSSSHSTTSSSRSDIKYICSALDSCTAEACRRNGRRAALWWINFDTSLPREYRSLDLTEGYPYPWTLASQIFETCAEYLILRNCCS